MAKSKNEIKFTNAEINWDDKKIIESTKDSVLVYDLNKIMKEWDGKDGLSMTIFQNLEIEADETEY